MKSIGIFVEMTLLGLLIFLFSCSDGKRKGDIGDPCKSLDDCKEGLFCSEDGYCYAYDGGEDVKSDSIDVEEDGERDSDIVDLLETEDISCEGVICEGRCCDPDELCIDRNCTETFGRCTDNNQCQNDSCCYNGYCVPYGTSVCGDYNRQCHRVVIAGLFQPTLQCEWNGPPPGDPFPNHVHVLGTPVVADLNLDKDPNTIQPMILFNSYDGLDGDSGTYTELDGVLRIINGADCRQLYSIGPYTNGCNTPAVADLDGDGTLEIVLHWNDGAVEIYGYDNSSQGFIRLYYSHTSDGSRYAPGHTGWGAPSIYDLNDDGVPEIVSGGVVYSNTGLVIDNHLGFRVTWGIWNGQGSGFPVVADLDYDGRVELPVGAMTYEFDPMLNQWVEESDFIGNGSSGYVAVADFGTYNPYSNNGSDNRYLLDGIAEVVIVRSGTVRIETSKGRVIFGPFSLPQSQGGGPPTIGDFDGDGLPEFAAAGSDSYTVFDPDCVSGVSDRRYCPTGRTDGILWSQPSQDHSSNITGSSIFDFEGDGKAEAIYADECFVRVYDGSSGEVLYSQWRSSCTWNENPIVADVDNDFNAELIVPSNENCSTSPQNMGSTQYERDPQGRILDPLFKGLRCSLPSDCPSGICNSGFCRCRTDEECGVTGFVCAPPPQGTPGTGNTCRAAWLGSVHGLRVYRDILDRWVDTRTIWNQHAYSITHIEEDGRVPRTSQWVQNWLMYNNFRQNVQGDLNAENVPDLTSGNAGIASCDRNGLILRVNLCNRGTASVPPGIRVTFYKGEPTECEVMCIVPSNRMLAPGECEVVECYWDRPIRQPTDIYIRADDNGNCNPQNNGSESECIEENNLSVIRGIICEDIG